MERNRDSEERGETGLQLSGRKKKLEDYYIIQLIFFYTDQHSAAIQAVTFVKLRKLSGFCCYREKAKFNWAASPFHCKQTSSALFKNLSRHYHQSIVIHILS